MTIQSISYLLFVVVVWLLNLSAKSNRMRQWLLLAASYLFYATWGLNFLAVLAFASAMNYGWGELLKRRRTAARLSAGISCNIALLVMFKYLPAWGATGHNAGASAIFQHIIVPVGISFWTFQAISYLIDIYREEELDASILEVFLYMAFWPTVLSGPICRMPKMIPQFRAMTRPHWDDVSAGVNRIVIGLFMKMVLAQTLQLGFNPGEGVAYGFDQIPGGWGGLDVWLLALGFGFQLFFDFAGYSHIVIGTARLFGIRLEENFRSPYFSTTPSAFWTRWHMSLSFWIRDYVFLPLATAFPSLMWRNVALVLSMILFGIWHGASFPFLIWGVYQGVVLCCHRIWQQLGRRMDIQIPDGLSAIFGWAITFGLICIGWIFFRAHNLNQISQMITAVLTPSSYRHLVMKGNFYVVVPVLVCGYFLYSAVAAIILRLRQSSVVVFGMRTLAPVYYAVALFLIIAWSKENPPFVYFQF